MGIMAWVKLNANSKTVDDVKGALEKHLNSSNPHDECAVHSNLLHAIKESVDRIDERVYELFKNNGHKQ